MKSEAGTEVADFLLRAAPKELVGGLRVLAKLKMPLHDERALRDQLEEMESNADDDTKAVVRRVVELFGGRDFPILSTENAFEKFASKFDPIPFPFPGLTAPVEVPVAPQERPSACEVYERTFGRGSAAASCACRAYAEALREGMTDLQATVVGHFSGRRSQRTGICPV